MRLEKVQEVIVESSGEYEEHIKKVEEKIKELNPEYYIVDTDIIRVVLRTTITVLESYQ